MVGVVMEWFVLKSLCVAPVQLYKGFAGNFGFVQLLQLAGQELRGKYFWPPTPYTRLIHAKYLSRISGLNLL